MTPNPQNNTNEKNDLLGERKKTSRDNLQKNAEGFYSVFDKMLEDVKIPGHDWRYLYLNAAAERHNRRPNQELPGRKYIDMWPGIECGIPSPVTDHIELFVANDDHIIYASKKARCVSVTQDESH